MAYRGWQASATDPRVAYRCDAGHRLVVDGRGGAASPSNRVWKVIETETGRVLTTVKSGYGDESDPGAELAADLEALSPTEFASRWGFTAGV